MALRPDPGITLDFPDGDKFLHVITFVCLLGWWGNIFRRRRAHWWVALGLLVFGIFIECAQWLDPPRDADALDVLADAVGIALGLLLLRTPLGHVLIGLEDRLLHPPD